MPSHKCKVGDRVGVRVTNVSRLRETQQRRETALAQRGGLGCWIEVSGQGEVRGPQSCAKWRWDCAEGHKGVAHAVQIGLCCGPDSIVTPLEMKQYCCCCAVEDRVLQNASHCVSVVRNTEACILPSCLHNFP